MLGVLDDGAGMSEGPTATSGAIGGDEEFSLYGVSGLS